jgi:hypothetical protein
VVAVENSLEIHTSAVVQNFGSAGVILHTSSVPENLVLRGYSVSRLGSALCSQSASLPRAPACLRKAGARGDLAAAGAWRAASSSLPIQP